MAKQEEWDALDATAAAMDEMFANLYAGSEVAGLSRKVTDELRYARTHYPDWPADLVHAVAIASEEMGEIVKDANSLHWSQKPVTVAQIRQEIVQAMAMLVRLYTETPILQEKADG